MARAGSRSLTILLLAMLACDGDREKADFGCLTSTVVDWSVEPTAALAAMGFPTAAATGGDAA